MYQHISKTMLTARTYWQAGTAIRRQFDYSRLLEVQNNRLRQLIAYVYNDIKYYRELFKAAGLRPDDIKSSADLSKIPILTKQQLRDRFWDFLPRDLPKCRVSRTSGSTGVPVCILSDVKSRCQNSAAVIRHRKAAGIRLIGGSILTPLKTANDPYDVSSHWTFMQGIHRTDYVNPYIDTTSNINRICKLIGRLKRPALIGITPAVRKLAYKINDGVIPRFTPRVIMTTGEILTPEVRRLLESTFNANVVDIYGCNEAGDIAWQCRQGQGYHINIDNVIVEILKDGQSAQCGQIGDVVITNLNRYAMPIIRYKNGDLARACQDFCPCGCKLPTLAEIIGRSGQDILLPDGTAMPWNQLKSLMNHPGIRQFQLVQNPDASLTVRYVRDPTADKTATEELIMRRYRGLLGDCIPITIDSVKTIAPAHSGKSKLVVSNFTGVQHSHNTNLPGVTHYA